MARKNKTNLNAIITGIVVLGIMLLVGNNVMTSVGTTIGAIDCTAINATDDTCGAGAGVSVSAPLATPLSFLGLADNGGTWSATGIVGILGLAAVAGFVLFWIRRSIK